MQPELPTWVPSPHDADLEWMVSDGIQAMWRDEPMLRAMADAGISDKAVECSGVGKSPSGALQIPVWNDRPFDSDLIDLCLFPMMEPERWALWNVRGRVLGADQLREAQFCGDALPLHVHENPLDWLCDSCRGVVVLFPSTLATELLGVKAIIVKERFAPRCNALFRRWPVDHPKILVRRVARPEVA